MKLFKLCLAAFAAASFAAACNSNQTAQNTNTNAAPTPAATKNAATPAAPAATPDELAAAAGDFSKFCINCHKADGTGGRVELDKGETINVESLREHGLKDSDAELAKQIREGGDDMPPFKTKLDAQRIDNLVRYIRREFHGRTVSAPAAAATPATPAH
ncbi:MAG: cytochrome c [Acidobacteria bacterium]|nr:cytochrome c [Acidobacteriota bacterium]